MLRRSLARSFAQIVEVKSGWMHLPILGRPAAVELRPVTLTQAVGELKALGFSEVEFRTLDGVKFSSGSLLSQLSSQSFSIKLDKHSFNVVPELSQKLGRIDELIKELRLSFNEKEVISNYLGKLATGVKLNSHGDISATELSEAMKEALPREKNTYKSREEMEEKLKEYTEEYTKLTRFDAEFEMKARRYAMRVVWSGLFVLLMQWAYIGLGTFVYYSWDVMEPQSYLIALGNLIVGVSFYIFKRREFAIGSVISVLKEGKMKQLYTRKGINTQRVQQVREYIDHINRIIKQ